MKISILRIIVIEEGEKNQVKGKENIFNNIIGENFSTLKEGDTLKVQEGYRTPIRLNQKKFPSSHNNQNYKHIEQTDGRGKHQVIYKGRLIRITSNFSKETLKLRTA